MTKFSMTCYICGGFAGLTLWQHIGKNTNTLKPSDIINKLIYGLDMGFSYMGNKFALLSSFYEKLKLHQLGTSAYEIIQPSCQLIVTPMTSFVKGYYDYLKNSHFLNSPYTIYMGSITLALLSLYFGYHIVNKYCPCVATFLSTKYSTIKSCLVFLFAPTPTEMDLSRSSRRRSHDD